MERKKNVRLEKLVKEFVMEGKQDFFRAVDSIDVEIPAGAFVTLLGPSGCGKTTTLRMIAGFEDASSGSIFIGNDCVNSIRADKRDTTMVFQSYALFPHLTVKQNISYGLKLKKMKEAELQAKTQEIIRLVGLVGLEQRFPNQLSGGQQQRVALARALVMEPSVLLFDEPLSNLDAKLRIVMRREIRRIQQSLGLTSIYVTHDQAEAMSLSDIIIIMNQGKIEQIGSPMEIYKYPESEFVADFIGSANFLEAEIASWGDSEAVVSIADTKLSLEHRNHILAEKGDKVKLVVRPEAIEIDRTGTVEGWVVNSTYLGAIQEYVVMVGDNEVKVEVSNPDLEKIYQVNDKVSLKFDPKNIHILLGGK